MNKKMSILEGLLFIAGDDGITKSECLMVLDLPELEELEQIISSLEQKYIADDSSGLNIQRFALDKLRLTTKKSNYDYYLKLTKIKEDSKLSSAAIETLAVIAYKGPVTKSEVEYIRGVNCDNVFYKLKFKNLISESGKSELPGKPMLYVVTDNFMKLLNINDLSELPKIDSLNEVEGKSIF